MHWVQRLALKNTLKHLQEGKEMSKETMIFILEAALQKDFEYVKVD